jgi:hypothetical protein
LAFTDEQIERFLDESWCFGIFKKTFISMRLLSGSALADVCIIVSGPGAALGSVQRPGIRVMRIVGTFKGT